MPSDGSKKYTPMSSSLVGVKVYVAVPELSVLTQALSVDSSVP